VTLTTDQLEVVLDALDMYRQEQHHLLMLSDNYEETLGIVSERLEIAVKLMRELGVEIGTDSEEEVVE
jgi:CBS domain containing-hemolysin-like protein